MSSCVRPGEKSTVGSRRYVVMFTMKKWLKAAGLRLEKCGRRFFMTSVSFALLTVFLVFDRSYVESAMSTLDLQFTPFSSFRKEEDDGPLRLTVTAPPPLFPGCNIFDGKWVYDETYPLYDMCHLAELDFQCQFNGRLDRSYRKWRWQPYECSIPRFDAQDMLARLKGLRVVIIGDSLGREQWESLNCLLLQGVRRKDSVELVNAPITKLKFHLGTRFNDHDVTIDYYRSPYLLLESRDIPKNSPKRVVSTVKLKKMDKNIAPNIVNADVVLLNTGHWWVSSKTYNLGCYFQKDDKLMLGLPVIDAYEQAIDTITSWVNDHVNFSRTEVFFRSFEPSHWEVTEAATQPYNNISQARDLRRNILKNAVGKMQSPATVLDITSLSSYRPDGHIFNWSDNNVFDCVHWCLPGVPDNWNELLYASLLLGGRGVWSAKNRTEETRIG